MKQIILWTACAFVGICAVAIAAPADTERPFPFTQGRR
jgi:hypothetical protein